MEAAALSVIARGHVHIFIEGIQASTFDVREPQSTHPSPRGCLTLPAAANAFSARCCAQESPQSTEHPCPQPLQVLSSPVPLQLPPEVSLLSV